MTKKSGSAGKDKDTQSFEKSLERLEKIVEDMEGGALGLEEMIGRFEEGQTLIKFCSNKLNEVEQKIEKLVKKGGKLKTEPLDGAEAEKEEDSEEEEELF